MPEIAELAQPVATIGQYGLPWNADSIIPLGSLRGCNCLFVGDADPADLFVFAWLREQMPIAWHAVNDDFLVRRGNRDNVAIRISLTEAEASAVSILPELCPDHRRLLGEYCSTLFDMGLKIEVEGALMATDSRLGSPPNA